MTVYTVLFRCHRRVIFDIICNSVFRRFNYNFVGFSVVHNGRVHTIYARNLRYQVNLGISRISIFEILKMPLGRDYNSVWRLERPVFQTAYSGNAPGFIRFTLGTAILHNNNIIVQIVYYKYYYDVLISLTCEIWPHVCNSSRWHYRCVAVSIYNIININYGLVLQLAII